VGGARLSLVARSRRILVAVAVGAAVAAGVAGAFAVTRDPGGSREGSSEHDVRTVQPGAPGEDGRELSGDDAAGVEAPEHTAADTAFMQNMVVHHTQALDMAALVDERTDSEDLPLLAERITVSQESEISLIERWLTDRDEAVPQATDTAGHAGMPGMATPDQLAQLDAARGPAFDALFLELMIAHHRGALTMVDQLYDAGAGLEPAVDGFAREVEADQTIEIARMADMQPARGL
jgi:uncharacterized protein (DUF305 family)